MLRPALSVCSTKPGLRVCYFYLHSHVKINESVRGIHEGKGAESNHYPFIGLEVLPKNEMQASKMHRVKDLKIKESLLEIYFCIVIGSTGPALVSSQISWILHLGCGI